MRSRPGRKIRLKASLEELRTAGVLLDESLAAGPMVLPSVFGNTHPVEVEIGPGKGTFLLRRAAARPEMNLLGIEWLCGYAAYAADRACRAGLTNVRLLCADAQHVVSRCLSDKSVCRFHIHFPDPWPKRKHRRRRLIRPDFALHLRRVLRLGGIVSIITDHAGYFRQIRWVLAATHGFAAIEFIYGGSLRQGPVCSNFERKYTAQGKRFHAISLIRYA